MRRFAVAGLAGWGAIMALGWWLADRRAVQCSDTYNCTVQELGTRDAFLVLGLLVPFLIIAAMAFLGARPGAQFRWWQTGTNVPLLARSVSRDFAPEEKVRPLRFIQGTTAWTGGAIVAAFAFAWLCAYIALVWMPEQSAATAMTEVARDAAEEAADAAAAASDAAAEADASPRLVPVPGNPFGEPPSQAEPAQSEDQPSAAEENVEPTDEDE